MSLSMRERPVYTIEGDWKRWHYFSLDAAVRRFALARLKQKYPIEVFEYEYGRKEYESDIEYEQRQKIVNRYVRRFKKTIAAQLRREAER